MFRWVMKKMTNSKDIIDNLHFLHDMSEINETNGAVPYTSPLVRRNITQSAIELIEKQDKRIEECRNQIIRYEEEIADLFDKNGKLTKIVNDCLQKEREQPLIVHCEDCKFYDLRDGRCYNRHAPCGNRMTPRNWFCAEGELLK